MIHERIRNFGFRISDFGISSHHRTIATSQFGFRISDFGFRNFIAPSQHRISDFGFRISSTSHRTIAIRIGFRIPSQRHNIAIRDSDLPGPFPGWVMLLKGVGGSFRARHHCCAGRVGRRRPVLAQPNSFRLGADGNGVEDRACGRYRRHQGADRPFRGGGGRPEDDRRSDVCERRVCWSRT